MNKAELIDAVSGKTGLQKAEATRAVDAVFDSITAALKGGDSVALLGFGTFVVKGRAARAGAWCRAAYRLASTGGNRAGDRERPDGRRAPAG